MASYHCHVKVGAKGKAGPHADYILREGKYENTRGLEELESSGSGNMPKWAEHKPSIFWRAADEHEREKGSAYREIEGALPRELTPPQRLDLVNDFMQRAFGRSHAHTFAIHNPQSAIDGGEQPHVHIMYSERVLDGIERDPDQYFKRYNAKAPEKGGCKKDSAGTKDRLQATRELWAEVQNEHLARHGIDARVDHRSLKDQGIDRAPQRHIPRKEWAALTDLDISKILTMRSAEGELERAKKEVSLIDVSGDLAAARADRDRKAQAEARAERDSHKRQQAKEQAAKSWDLMKSAISQPVVAPPPPPRKAIDELKAQAAAAKAKAEAEAAAKAKARQPIDVAAGVQDFKASFDAAKAAAAPATRTDHEVFKDRNRARIQAGIDRNVAAGRTVAPASTAERVRVAEEQQRQAQERNANRTQSRNDGYEMDI